MTMPRRDRPTSPPTIRPHLLALTAVLANAGAMAQSATPDLPVPPPEDCVKIGTDLDRLACYDRAFNRSASRAATEAARETPITEPAQHVAGPNEATKVLTTDGTVPLVSGTGLWSTIWELDPPDKKGTFTIKTYYPNVLLPIHWSTSINESPSSPTREAAENVRDDKSIEAKFQLSLRSKVLQNFGLPGGDLWLAYTQQSLWQVWNPAESAPFRSTDYQAEAIYNVPVTGFLRDLPFGWEWTLAQVAVAHQSNGQSKPLSRSWNRAYAGVGLERGNFGVLARAHYRFREDGDDDDNPDLLKYIGHGDLSLVRAPGVSTTTLNWKVAKDLGKGAWQLDWSYPVYADQPRGLRYYVQLYSGYGESLLDYNHRQTSIGLGFSLFEF